MEDPWRYRNKSQFQVGVDKQKVIAGLYGLNSHRLIDIENCPIQHKATNHVTKEIKRILQDLQIPIYNERKRRGIVRTIVSRVGFETGEVQIVLITAKKKFRKRAADERNSAPPAGSEIARTKRKRPKTSLIFGDETFTLAGKSVIQETLGDISFELSARAFSS